MSQFVTGKIPTDVLVRNVFRYTGRVDRSVILGSSVGEDAALVSLGRHVLVMTTDPVTGATSDLGWLSVHVNANDIACRGATPRWFLCDLLLPEKSGVRLLDSIMQQVDQAAKEIGVAIVGGHTEVTPGLVRPIVVGYMLGLAGKDEYVTSSGARPGDDVIMTKYVGIEGTGILAADFTLKLRSKINPKALRTAKSMRHWISIVEDARLAVQSGGVRAMHDPTEGGLLQGVWELAEASNVGFRIQESEISILPETAQICSVFNLDPLRLMSSGCLLIVAQKQSSRKILRRLRAHDIPGNVIGKITSLKSGRKLVRTDGRVREIGPSERDELYRVIESHRAR
ncbi:MAG TPA: AIR synthase family protein [Terriglobales bacterium]|nr:AIR synthase family protein [Terriglobales bacterium]